jgi:hypothetical protein
MDDNDRDLLSRMMTGVNSLASAEAAQRSVHDSTDAEEDEALEQIFTRLTKENADEIFMRND